MGVHIGLNSQLEKVAEPIQPCTRQRTRNSLPVSERQVAFPVVAACRPLMGVRIRTPVTQTFGFKNQFFHHDHRQEFPAGSSRASLFFGRRNSRPRPSHHYPGEIPRSVSCG
ncbi:MAG TPA: hypothetical protein DIC23_08905 [Planctomycetaceae bacterium]|nr:hypothetical protein [Planctomycetaceae bacterium]